MTKMISPEQLYWLEQMESFSVEKEEFHRLLEEYTGITAEPYTGYAYYDQRGDYIGDSLTSTVKDLLKSACIGILEGHEPPKEIIL